MEWKVLKWIGLCFLRQEEKRKSDWLKEERPESTKRREWERREMLLLKMIPISIKVKRVYTPTAAAFLQIRLVTEKEERALLSHPNVGALCERKRDSWVREWNWVKEMQVLWRDADEQKEGWNRMDGWKRRETGKVGERGAKSLKESESEGRKWNIFYQRRLLRMLQYLLFSLKLATSSLSSSHSPSFLSISLASLLVWCCVEDARNIYDIFCSARLQIEIYDRPENGGRREREWEREGITRESGWEKGRGEGSAIRWRLLFHQFSFQAQFMFLVTSWQILEEWKDFDSISLPLSSHLFSFFSLSRDEMILPLSFNSFLTDKHFDGSRGVGPERQAREERDKMLDTVWR